MPRSAVPPPAPSDGTPGKGMPTFGTVPLGPDEPELFTDAMERILDHLSSDDFDRNGRHSA